MGSSKKWAATDDGSKSPFLQPDPGLNPDFHGAGRVLVPYCSGDTHVGNQSAATPATFGLWFTGAANLKAIVNDLQAHRGMPPAAHVLLSGESAGAMGTFQMADWLTSWLPPTAVVQAAPVSGWFMPAETGNFRFSDPARRISRLPPSNYANFSNGRIGPWDNSSDLAEDQAITKLWNPLRVPGCTADLPTDLAYLCRTIDSAYPCVLHAPPSSAGGAAQHGHSATNLAECVAESRSDLTNPARKRGDRDDHACHSKPQADRH